jgi:LacI family transcriptional regulator
MRSAVTGPDGNPGNSTQPARGVARISDVAALAGVSVGTASKALNGRGQLREQTRERVRAAAEQLGFQPNTVARSLLQGRTYTVGLITTDHYGRFSIPLMRGAEDALGAGQMAALMCESREDPIREQHYVRTLLGRRVDGLIVAARRTDARPPLAQHLPIPVVYAFAPSSDPADCSVVSDEAAGVRMAVEHLLESGRRRIAHVTGPTGHHSATVRAESFEDTLGEHGVQAAGGRVWFGAWSEIWGRQAAQALLVADPDVDAVFCGSDQIARGVADALREAGARLPDDIALVGVDNWEALAENCRPSLTTVDLNLELVGRTAGELLLRAIDGHATGGTHVIQPRLVVRESSAPAARRVTER